MFGQHGARDGGCEGVQARRALPGSRGSCNCRQVFPTPTLARSTCKHMSRDTAGHRGCSNAPTVTQGVADMKCSSLAADTRPLWVHELETANTHLGVQLCQQRPDARHDVLGLDLAVCGEGRVLQHSSRLRTHARVRGSAAGGTGGVVRQQELQAGHRAIAPVQLPDACLR